LRKSITKIRWWMWGVPFITVALVAGIVLLVLDATDAILTSADGDLDEVIIDPDAPGYETFVNSTPSHLSMIESSNGSLVSVSIISLFPNDEGGSLVVLPPELVISEEITLKQIYEADSSEGVEFVISEFVNIGFDSVAVLKDDFWVEHFSRIGSLPITIEDSLTISENEEQVVVFESGNVTVPAEQIGEFLAWINEGESPYNRWLRHQNFWVAWVSELATRSNGPVQSDSEEEFLRMINGLSNGEMVLLELELLEREDTSDSFSIDQNRAEELLLQMIPFPKAAYAGSRAKIKLLDGVGDLDLPNGYVPSLVSVGGQIMLLGNAESYGVETTQIIYHDKIFEEFVNNFSDVLEGAELTYDPVAETAVDVTVIIGQNSLAIG